MALISCPECGKQISSKAPTCPNCGAPVVGGGSIASPDMHGKGEGIFMKSMNCGCMAMLFIVGLVVLTLVCAGLKTA